MTLLELLAFPDKFELFQEVRKQIAVHCVSDNAKYLALRDRFIELTGKKDEETKQYIGY